MSETAPSTMQVYGSKISYYTGKLEAYLRYRGISYEKGNYLANQKRMEAGAGVAQMPVVELTDGRWMSDTTPIIAWFEAQQDKPSIYPANSALNFFALLIEDYADEWLWRSAMHYRWTYSADRQYAAESLYEELIKDTLPIPRFVALRRLKRRQLGGFVQGDGVSDATRLHADSTYLSALDCLQAIFEKRPFILGNTPTIADFGMMAPMFRHFSMDPTPAEIMRTLAPAVYEWVARMWNLPPATVEPELIAGADDALQALLIEMCETNLVQHAQNALAYGLGDERFDVTIQGCGYTHLPTSRYRVWCLETLRRAYEVLDSSTQTQVQNTLQSSAAKILWDATEITSSEYDADRRAPFNKAINVYPSGVPSRR